MEILFVYNGFRSFGFRLNRFCRTAQELFFCMLSFISIKFNYFHDILFISNAFPAFYEYLRNNLLPSPVNLHALNQIPFDRQGGIFPCFLKVIYHKDPLLLHLP